MCEDANESVFQKTTCSNMRPQDRLYVLKGASRSFESGEYKNTLFDICPDTPGINPNLFSPHWYAGVSFIQICNKVGKILEHESEIRKKFLQELKTKVECRDYRHEHSNRHTERDHKLYTESSCLGLYRGYQYPERSRNNLHREHIVYYIVCKSDAGLEAFDLSERVNALLEDANVALRDVFGGGEGNINMSELRELSNLSRRRRCDMIKTCVSCAYNALSEPHPTVEIDSNVKDVQYNRLDVVEDAHSSRYLYYAGCALRRPGEHCIIALGAASGFLISVQGDPRRAPHAAEHAAPMGPPRLTTTRDAMKNTRCLSETDRSWIQDHFIWDNMNGEGTCMPGCFGGMHAQWHSPAAMGADMSSCVHISPVAVLIASPDEARLMTV